MGFLTDDNIVLDCYRLAYHYKQNPELFLNMTLGEVQTHLSRTIQLMKIMNAESAPDGD